LGWARRGPAFFVLPLPIDSGAERWVFGLALRYIAFAVPPLIGRELGQLGLLARVAPDCPTFAVMLADRRGKQLLGEAERLHLRRSRRRHPRVGLAAVQLLLARPLMVDPATQPARATATESLETLPQTKICSIGDPPAKTNRAARRWLACPCVADAGGPDRPGGRRYVLLALGHRARGAGAHGRQSTHVYGGSAFIRQATPDIRTPLTILHLVIMQ
jgi:hypothetical protein